MIGKLSLLVLGVFLVLGATACKGKVAYLGTDGNVYLANANLTGQTQLTFDAGRVIYMDPSWSWDGRYLAWVTWVRVADAGGTQPTIPDTTLSVYDTLTSKTKEFDFPDQKSGIFTFAWRRDRNSIYVSYSTQEVSHNCSQETFKGFRIVELDVETGSATKTAEFEEYGTLPRYIIASPNPNLLAVIVEEYCRTLRELCVLDLSRGEKRCTGYGTIGLPEWSPDGSRLVSNFCSSPCIDSTINFIDPQTLNKSAFLPETEHIIYGPPHWSPSGNLIIYYKHYARGIIEEESLGIWATTVDGTTTWKIDDGHLSSNPQVFSPDGLYITYTKGSETWISTLDGGFKYKLTSGAAPAWQPKEAVPTPPP